MPRGGRRPGAGAPRGNFNALKTGAASHRILFVLATLQELIRIDHPANPHIAVIVRHHFGRRRPRSNEDVRRFVNLIYPLLLSPDDLVAEANAIRAGHRSSGAVEHIDEALG